MKKRSHVRHNPRRRRRYGMSTYYILEVITEALPRRTSDTLNVKEFRKQLSRIVINDAWWKKIERLQELEVETHKTQQSVTTSIRRMK